jgi:Protein of unknown function (DUF3455)
MDRSSVSLVAACLAACSTVRAPTAAISLPEQLKPPPGESQVLAAAAKGVQIYECRAAPDRPGSFAWAFVAPEAELFGADGQKIGRHYAGPHWESTDGSKVVGTLKERADSPQPGAIPWLLLEATSVGSEGVLSKVTSVQRVNTAGGVAPQTGCSEATAGAQARVPYSADYFFFGRS